MIELLWLLLRRPGVVPRRIPSRWRAARDALDLEASPTERTPLRFVGRVEGREVELFLESPTLPTDRRTVIRVGTHLTLSLTAAGWRDDDQRIGDDELDALARIDGDPLEVQSVLGPLERRTLRDLLRRGDVRFSLTPRQLELRRAGAPPSATWLVQTTRELIRLATLLEGDRPLEQRLLARVRTEPRPQTRLHALHQALDLLGPELAAPALEHALYDPFGPIRALAAEALGRTDIVTELSPGQVTLVEPTGGLTLLDEDTGP